MTIAKLRGLSQFGIIADVDAYSLPPQAFSDGVNVRFRDGEINRAPVLRRVPSTLTYTAPRFLTSNLPTTGFDTLYVGYLNGQITSYKGGIQATVSASSWVSSSAELPYTSCHLGDVLYINRGDRVPWSLKTTDSVFQPLPSSGLGAWTSTYRAKILRACGGALCAFNITKGPVVFPTMIRTSEFALVNNIPSSWDESDPTTNATENVLAEMEGAITEASNFGENICVYGLKETWLMFADGSADVWKYRRLFSDAGCLGANCTVEVDSTQYVFGPDDVWKHDGVSKVSIINGKNKRRLFGSLNASKANRCFVVHDPIRKEIRFNYVGSDRLITFTGTSDEGCNRSAVFNLSEQTWTFDDLPYVFGGASSNLDIIATYSSSTGDYTVGGSFSDQEDSIKRNLCLVGASSSTFSLLTSIYAVDETGPGSTVAFSIDTNATRDWVLEKDGIDLDELPDLKDLDGYKCVNCIYPQARLESGTSISFQFGSANSYNEGYTLGDAMTYDGLDDSKLDYTDSGRYLFMRASGGLGWMKLTGLDVDVSSLGGL